MDIKINNLNKSFSGQPVLEGLSFSFPEGKSSCIMGPSGCGKTTLLHILMGIEEPDSGEVTGVPSGRLSAVFQEDRLCENLSVMANLKMVCSRRPEEELKEALAELGLSAAMGKPVRELSGGMCRRAAVLRALLSPSLCVMMDEPFKGLDRDNRHRTAAYIRKMIKGRTLITITHESEDIELLGADTILRFS
ncbi:ATP-binding cassette domain-containing protein [[Clostridium] hylemonae]|uniref:ABC transporter, ATP-binding protein n=1 Tax=[Clostridium] hylemonae DSM 15053 TaxID=553973 RepID=C0C0J5_9FIRM|nr:ATP-binding cassette domain-containing protein [[Clostridium] hylemonae]EEG74332.1 ABC transporter, ATP-binding protein [[Clostridium] hylemonae DSM 15053]